MVLFIIREDDSGSNDSRRVNEDEGILSIYIRAKFQEFKKKFADCVIVALQDFDNVERSFVKEYARCDSTLKFFSSLKFFPSRTSSRYILSNSDSMIKLKCLYLREQLVKMSPSMHGYLEKNIGLKGEIREDIIKIISVKSWDSEKDIPIDQQVLDKVEYFWKFR